jgi:subtilisin family serine protease
MIEMSGTSQAAPQVSALAASVKDLNSGLSASDLKEILTATAELTPELQGKVKYGAVNAARALKAASLSTTMPLYEAIQKAKDDKSLALRFDASFTDTEAPLFDFMPSLLH